MTQQPGVKPARGAGSADRVRAALDACGLADAIVTFEQSTKTAQMAADAMGCELGQIVKSIVFVADGSPVVALVAGDRRGDTDAIAAEFGARKVRMAEAETVREATGYAIGGVSPFDLPEELPVLVDDSLGRFEVLYPAAGTPQSMVRMDREMLMTLVRGRVARISS
ncbi:MAG: YbaK/EbsC family protein [Actinobacteria bacterium]|nr:YbaK/EbsC family protein [Actinomycetota bacterium]MCL5888161.1 YbaK/EbsC family protein [Actinomycetota bacterium]